MTCGKQKPFRLILACSHTVGYRVALNVLELRDEFPELVVRGILTDDPLGPHCNAKNRLWSWGFRDEHLLVPELARAEGIECYTGPVHPSDFRALVENEWRPDAVISSVFGQRIPKWLLDMCEVPVNVHPSFPGVWPSASAGPKALETLVAAGASEAELVLHVMVEEFDSGPQVAGKSLPLRPGESAEESYYRSADTWASLVRDYLSTYLRARRVEEASGCESRSATARRTPGRVGSGGPVVSLQAAAADSQRQRAGAGGGAM